MSEEKSIALSALDDIENVSNENMKLPEGSKIIIAPEKSTEKKKKERSEAQKQAFEKMRAKRLENDEKRRLAKGEKQKEMDNIKIQQEQEEEEERVRRAEELKQKLGVNVEVLKKRGRKAGQHIPYKKEVEKEMKSADVHKDKPVALQNNIQPAYTNPYMNMLLNKMRR
jgi:hypothetical protein